MYFSHLMIDIFNAVSTVVESVQILYRIKKSCAEQAVAELFQAHHFVSRVVLNSNYYLN